MFSFFLLPLELAFNAFDNKKKKGNKIQQVKKFLPLFLVFLKQTVYIMFLTNHKAICYLSTLPLIDIDIKYF